MKRVDITGAQFGRLTAVECLGKSSPNGGYRWLCRCACGNEVVVLRSNLGKHTNSCGCIRKETAVRLNATPEAKKRLADLRGRNTVHGLSRHPLHRVWSHMIERCEYAKHKSFASYGGKGVSVCPEWRKDFTSFYAWAMESGYKKGLSLDRIDNDLGYSPDNCRWATPREQTRNRSVSVKIGDDYLMDLAKQAGVCYNTLYWRLKKGWPLEDALHKPPKRRKGASE